MAVQETIAQTDAPTTTKTSADLRDDVLSDWPGDDVVETKTEETKADETKIEETKTEDKEVAADDEKEKTETEEPEDGDEEEEAEDEADEEEEEAEEADPVAAKRIAAIQAEEKRAKQALAAERQRITSELDVERRKLEDATAKVEAFASIQARAKRDPMGYLAAAGFGPDDYEELAKIVYGHSAAAQKNPKLRDDAIRLQRERGTIGEVEALRADIQKLKEERETERVQATQEREVAAYVGRVEKSVNGQAPLMSKLLEKNPDAARAQIVQAALALVEQTGIEPDPSDVIAEVERRERQLLIDRGIEPPPVGKKAAKKATPTGTKKDTEKAAETKKADDKKLPITKKPPDDDDSDEWKLREQIINDPEWSA